MDEEDELQIQARIKESGYQESFPRTEEEADAMDDLLADELAALSLSEQDKATFDLHGLAPEIEETEELIEKSLKDMENELQQIKKKPAFDKAMKMNPSHVQSRELRIRFLRCEFFKCKNAAKRLVLHFEKKEMLFGDGEILGRDVQLSDMSAEDMEYIKCGTLQVLPTRDISGRSGRYTSCLFFDSFVARHFGFRLTIIFVLLTDQTSGWLLHLCDFSSGLDSW